MKLLKNLEYCNSWFERMDVVFALNHWGPEFSQVVQKQCPQKYILFFFWHLLVQFKSGSWPEHEHGMNLNLAICLLSKLLPLRPQSCHDFAVSAYLEQRLKIIVKWVSSFSAATGNVHVWVETMQIFEQFWEVVLEADWCCWFLHSTNYFYGYY